MIGSRWVVGLAPTSLHTCQCWGRNLRLGGAEVENWPGRVLIHTEPRMLGFAERKVDVIHFFSPFFRASKASTASRPRSVTLIRTSGSTCIIPSSRYPLHDS